MCRNRRLTHLKRFVGEELGEILGEERGGVRDEEGVVRVEDGAVEGVESGEARGGVIGGGVFVVVGESGGEK